MNIDLNRIHLSSSEDANFKETENGVVSFEFVDGGETENINIVCKNDKQDFIIALEKDTAKAFANILKTYVEELES